MTFTRMKGVALWKAIAQELETDIAGGRMEAGSKLPTENELADRFQVNRHTVRRALTSLEEDGLVRVEQGSGWFVREQVIAYAVGRKTYFSENLSRESRIPGREVLGYGEMPAQGMVAKALGLPEGSPVVWIESIGQADGRRINVSTRFFPHARFPGIAEAYKQTGSVTRCMSQAGVRDYHRRTTSITARLPTAEEAKRLGQSRHRPVLVSESINVDADGTPVEYGLTRFSSDWVRIVVETDAG
ncbi:MAG: phosphonate metabolism transcriptional regulator PhnF [Solidesulfovibrio sp.]